MLFDLLHTKWQICYIIAKSSVLSGQIMHDKTEALAGGRVNVNVQVLRKSLQALEPMFGHKSIDALLREFEAQNAKVVDGKLMISLAEIEIALQNIFGTEASALILRLLMQKLFSKN